MKNFDSIRNEMGHKPTFTKKELDIALELICRMDSTYYIVGDNRITQKSSPADLAEKRVIRKLYFWINKERLNAKKRVSLEG